MKTRKVPVTQVIVPETRVTAVYDEELTKLLKDSIEATGVLQPVILVQTQDGYHLVDGLHRLQETISQGGSHIDAVVYEGEAKEALLMNLILNRVRGKTRASEMVMVINSLYTDYGLDPDAIREKTGLTRDYIEKLISIGRASPSVVEMLDEEIIGVGVAAQIARLPEVIQQEEVCAKARVWKYTVQDMKAFVDEVLEYMKQEPPSPTPQPQRVATVYYCEGCKQEVDPRWLRPVNVCPNCFGHLWRLGKEAAPPGAQGVDAEQEQGGG